VAEEYCRFNAIVRDEATSKIIMTPDTMRKRRLLRTLVATLLILYIKTLTKWELKF